MGERKGVIWGSSTRKEVWGRGNEGPEPRDGATHDSPTIADRSRLFRIIVPSPAVVVNYKSLAEQVERLAAQLSGAGIKAADGVAIILPKRLEFLIVFLAPVAVQFPKDATFPLLGPGHLIS